MFAIIVTGGKQYLATKGQRLVVEKLEVKAGDEIKLDRVLLVSDGAKTDVGQPTVDGAVVRAKVLRQFRGPKIVVLKYKPKVRYRRKQGHRQEQTELEIVGLDRK